MFLPYCFVEKVSSLQKSYKYGSRNFEEMPSAYIQPSLTFLLSWLCYRWPFQSIIGTLRPPRTDYKFHRNKLISVLTP